MGMWTEKEITALNAVEKKYKTKPPGLAELVAAAKGYRRAYRTWSRIYDRMSTIRGLGEASKKRNQWESDLYYAENNRDLKSAILKLTARCAKGI